MGMIMHGAILKCLTYYVDVQYVPIKEHSLQDDPLDRDTLTLVLACLRLTCVSMWCLRKVTYSQDLHCILSDSSLSLCTPFRCVSSAWAETER